MSSGRRPVRSRAGRRKLDATLTGSATDTSRAVAAPAGGDADDEDARALAGMASVAALTFLVARAVPLGWTVAVAAGVPLARAGERHGTRAGYATATASLVETTAIMGPARMGIPVPHAASAPLLGAMHRRRASFAALTVAAAAVRTVYYTLTAAFSIVVLIGLDAYLGTYERLRDLFGFLPAGTAAALWVTFAQLVLWSIGAGMIQAWAIRRGLRRWDAQSGPVGAAGGAAPARRAPGRHATAIVLAGIVAFTVALASTDPRVLGGLAAMLLLCWAATAASGGALLRGLVLAAPLALSTLGFGLAGGIGAELAGLRAARVALLVLIAVWVRSAAGAEGLRRALVWAVRRLRRVPMLATTAAVLAGSTQADDLGAAARRLGGRLRCARRRPVPVIDAVLGWLAEESSRIGAPASQPRPPGA